MKSPDGLKRKKSSAKAHGPLWLIIIIFHTTTLYGCLLDFDHVENHSSSPDDVFDVHDTTNDDMNTSTEDGPPVTSSDIDTQDTYTDTYPDTDIDTGTFSGTSTDDIASTDNETDFPTDDIVTETSIVDVVQDGYATFCEEAVEDEYMSLECGIDGRIFSIDFASFGQYVGSCAGGNPTIGRCHFDKTIAVIEAECLGRSNCLLIADRKDYFDDPCKKEEHFLIAKYTCYYEIMCPKSSMKSAPGKCGCDIPDHDSDGDGSADCNDLCKNDPLRIVPGLCGCNVIEEDRDEDGVPSCLDQCDDDEKKVEPGLCGCGKKDDHIDDRDGDGTVDCMDSCPDDPNKIYKGICGCNKIDDPTDRDHDGTIDCKDKCPDDPNKKDPGDCGCGRAESFLCLF